MAARPVSSVTSGMAHLLRADHQGLRSVSRRGPQKQS
jgi:hypothetical protein